MSKVRLYGDTSGYVDLKAPDVASNVTITLPNTTGPFATETYVDSAVASIPGIGSNVVQTVKTDTFTTSSATYGALTGMSVSITPSSLTSKVLVLIDLAANGTAGTRAVQVRLLRGGTVLYVGDAAGSRIQAWLHSESGTADLPRSSGVYLDSPNTTSPVTYSLEIKSNSSGQVVYVNRTPTDTDLGFFSRVASSITAIEVAA